MIIASPKECECAIVHTEKVGNFVYKFSIFENVLYAFKSDFKWYILATFEKNISKKDLKKESKKVMISYLDRKKSKYTSKKEGGNTKNKKAA